MRENNNYALEVLKGVVDSQQRQIDTLLETIKELNSALAEAIKPVVPIYADPSPTPLWYSEEEEDAKFNIEHKDDLKSALAELGLDANLNVIPIK